MKLLRCYPTSLSKFAGKHYKTQPYRYLMHAQFEIFARNVEVITLHDKKQKNGFHLGNGTECVHHSLSQFLSCLLKYVKISLTHFHPSRSLSLGLFPANGFISGTRTLSLIFLILYFNQTVTQFPSILSVTTVKIPQNGLCKICISVFFFGLSLGKEKLLVV